MKPPIPIIIGSKSGKLLTPELLEAGIPPESFVVASEADGVISHLKQGSPQLVIVDTSSQFGIVNTNIAEAWIREANPAAEVTQINGWMEGRKHIREMRRFLRELQQPA